NLPPEAGLDGTTVEDGKDFVLYLRVGDPGEDDRGALTWQLASTNPAFPRQLQTSAGGVIDLVLPGLPAGTYPLVLTVTDKDGASATARATLTVVPVGHLPSPLPTPGPIATCDASVALDAEER